MKEKLQSIKEEALAQIQAADAPEKLNDVKVRFSNSDQRELKAIMDHIGWKRTGSIRQRGASYGKQRVYLRPKK